jgi:hypothetical protein
MEKESATDAYSHRLIGIYLNISLFKYMPWRQVDSLGAALPEFARQSRGHSEKQRLDCPGIAFGNSGKDGNACRGVANLNIQISDYP